MAMRSMLLPLAAGVVLALAGCTYYVPPPTTTVVPGAPASFDRSFGAAAGALRDQGLAISAEDRSTGTIVGKDGSVRVQFDAAGVRDQGLIGRVSRSYDQRMGR